MWAIEQDELSKRSVPNEVKPGGTSGSGQDVFIPWAMSQQNTNKDNDRTRAISRQFAGPLHDGKSENSGTPVQDEPQVFNRYYHMFAQGELAELVRGAASDLGLFVGIYEGEKTSGVVRGLEIVQDGWERSNYYIELQRWQK